MSTTTTVIDTITPAKAEQAAVALPENRFALELEFGKKQEVVVDQKSCLFSRMMPITFSLTTILSPLLPLFQVQSLASPAYLHHLATSTTSEGQSLLLDPKFKEFLRYLQKTWSQPEYVRYIVYPHSLYFLELLIKNDSFCRELAQVSFRNFCHQQQYFAWQNRFVTLYGSGEPKSEQASTANVDQQDEGS
jgi:mediator of RNA polymerase II transcription subunit 31